MYVLWQYYTDSDKRFAFVVEFMKRWKRDRSPKNTKYAMIRIQGTLFTKKVSSLWPQQCPYKNTTMRFRRLPAENFFSILSPNSLGYYSVYLLGNDCRATHKYTEHFLSRAKPAIRISA
uniref:DUF4817 domain-containing protein n=1 Tax=Steinernema glaseri TaxID=37863 RepID=A0A1I8ADU2_9BILA